MNYELVITKTQPPCGGKSTTTHEIRAVETDDLIGYIRTSESDLPKDFPLEGMSDGKGTTRFEFQSGASTITYEFTED